MARHRQIDDPLVSLVLPVRNEAPYIELGLDAIDAQSYPRDRIDIIVVDGGSTDGTVEIIKRRMTTDSRTRLLGGHGVNTPAAMRIGADAAEGDVIIKVDGHGWMNDRFVEAAVSALSGDPRVGCVGGLIRPLATTDVERAIAIARFSRLGVGGGVYTLSARAQETDTVQCGAYRRQALDDAGGFDPAMAYGEDEELNYRVRQAGWRILLHPGMEFSYRVRSSLRALFRQYFRYGRARVAVVRKHPSFFRLKHALPSVLVLVLGTSGVLLAFPASSLPGTVVIGGYLATVLAGGLFLAAKHRFGRPDLVTGALLMLHTGYGLGAIRGLFDRSDSAHRGSEGGERPPSPLAEGDRVTHQPQAEDRQG